MDGFDDLLSSSNPFANPFAQARSSSPDPWATFGQQSQDTVEQDFSSGLDSSAPYDNFQIPENHHDTASNAGDTDSRTPEDATAPKSFDNTALGPSEPVGQRFPLSPGFRESVSTEKNDDASDSDAPAQHASPALKEDVFTSEQSAMISPVLPPLASPRLPSSAMRSPSSVPPTFSAQAPAFDSPLDSGFGARIEPSFASLALGGESIGGWQDSESMTRSIEATSEEVVPPDAQTPPPTKSVSQPSGSSSRPTFVISVDDPQKVGDAIRPYILYTVHTTTTSPLFNKPSFSVLRRYSDFLWLVEMLSLNNPGVIVPPVPEKSSFGRFENHFIQQRRLALEKCVQKIVAHPLLAKDPDLKAFLESDSFALDIKHRKNEIAQERGGLMSSIGQTIAGPKFYEVDEWFDKKKMYLDSLEVQLKGLVKSIETVSRQRSELVAATNEFAVSIGELSGSDLSKDLSHFLSMLSDVEKKAGDIQNSQAQDDVISFLSIAEEYVRLINSVRMAFDSRIRCHAIYQNSEVESRRVKQTYEKARNQGKIAQDRLGHSLAHVADAERKAVEAKQEFDNCSKLIKAEFSRFEEERVGDFKVSLETLLEGMIRRQNEMIKGWESYQEQLLSRAHAKQRAAQATPGSRAG